MPYSADALHNSSWAGDTVIDARGTVVEYDWRGDAGKGCVICNKAGERWAVTSLNKVLTFEDGLASGECALESEAWDAV